jgi:hypothetical protein
MIHHLSVAARDPRRVAQVFAELLDGVALPFPPNPGSFMAVARDGHGTGVEVHPADIVLEPNGEHGARFAALEPASPFSAVHFALSVSLETDAIAAIARREGWHCVECSRGGDFDVIELWVENRWLVELMPPAFAARYLAFAGKLAAALDPSAMMTSHAPA